jgi:hypothetical protein
MAVALCPTGPGAEGGYSKPHGEHSIFSKYKNQLRYILKKEKKQFNSF